MKIALIVPLVERDEGALSYGALRDFARHAEARGFDSLWFVDHLLLWDAEQPPRGVWGCWTMLAALAAAVARVICSLDLATTATVDWLADALPELRG